jgi:hypothetical protein
MAQRGIAFLEGVKDMYLEKQIPPHICPVKTRLGAGIFTSTLLEFKKWQRAKAMKEKQDQEEPNFLNEENTAIPTNAIIGPFFDLMTFDDFWNWDFWPDTMKEAR